VTGQTIAHYRILEKLGEGGMGVVYKAEDLKLRRIVALKFLSDKSLADPIAKARFLREAQSAGCLDHPNICHVYDLEESGEKMFIVMAYVEGRSLTHRLGEGITLGQALELAIQVGEGLKAAHSRGIIHRDVKPANILVGRDEVARITDFGLARIEQRSRITKPGTFMGTVSAMAPEQIRAEDADARTDIWAFGVMLYEICTGRRPFQRATHEASMQAILREDPVRPCAANPKLPPDLDWILGKALAKLPGERYQHIDDLVADLRALRRGLSAEQQGCPVGAAAMLDTPTQTIGQRTWIDRILGSR
jgi:serine/threonine protein kinase